MMNISIDYREKKRVKKAQKYYESKNHKVEVKNLESGDYVFDNQVAFEFKTFEDMFQSIMDGRLFDEAHRQADSYPWHYIIIAGNDKSRKNALYRLFKLHVKFSIKQYYGAIASLNTFTRVIYAPNTPRAFQIMECQAKKCLDGKIRVRTPKVNTVNPAFNLLMFLPDIKEQRAKLLVEELGLETFDDLQNISYDKLISVKGIGEVTAKNILNGIGKYGLL